MRYGRHDCCTVARGWALAVTGIDVFGGDSYANLKDGMEKLAALGHEDHTGLFAAVFRRVPKLRLREGDIAVLPGGDGTAALGIVQSGGETIWCFGPGGAWVCPLTAAEYGFEVRA
jgi:hypothetical protein